MQVTSGRKSRRLSGKQSEALRPVPARWDGVRIDSGWRSARVQPVEENKVNQLLSAAADASLARSVSSLSTAHQIPGHIDDAGAEQLIN